MSHSRPRIVVPVKPFASAKTRLETLLRPAERAALASIMLKDVLAIVTRSALIGVVVVTGDNEAADIARRYGADVLPDRAGDGLCAALVMAADTLRRESCPAMVIVPSDVPALTSATVNQLCECALSGPSVALISAARDGGTNALALSPPKIIPPLFGYDSFRRHVAAAQRIGIEPTVIRGDGAERDIDVADDIEAFLSLGSRTLTHDFLRSIGFPARGLERPALQEAWART